jgi:hypothetical protein
MAVIRAKLFQTAYGQNVMNVLHFDVPDFVSSMLPTIAASIRDNWINNVRAVQTANLLYTRINLSRPNGSEVPYDLVISITGAASAQNEMVPYFCHLLQLRTAAPGRTGRGRVYMAMVNPLLHFQGTLTPPFAALWNTPIANIIAAFGPSGSQPYFLSVNPHTSSESPHHVTSINVGPFTAVQRRRNIGVGT